MSRLADIFAPPASDTALEAPDAAIRSRHVRAVVLQVTGALTAEEVARAFEITETTFFRWKRLAPRYVEAEGLRRLMALKVDDADLID